MASCLRHSRIEKIYDFIFTDNLLDDIFSLGKTGGGFFDGIVEGVKYPDYLFAGYDGEFMLVYGICQKIGQIVLKILQIFLLGLGKVFVHVICPLLVKKKITSNLSISPSGGFGKP
jgi:hypothetical protein